MSINDNTEDIKDNVESNESEDEVSLYDKVDEQLVPDEEIKNDEEIKIDDTKVKSYRNRTLIVAACIFAVTVIAFAVWYVFFNNDITGVWETDVDIMMTDGTTKTEKMKFAFSDKEKMSFFENEKSYFSDKESLTAKAEMINGGRTFAGGYVTEADNNDQDYISMYFTATGSTITYNYELLGDIFSGRKLVLYNEPDSDTTDDSTDSSESDEIVFRQSEKTYSLDPSADFKPNKGVVGTWVYNDIIYSFDSEGRFCEDVGSSKIDGIYSFSEEGGLDTIVVKYKYSGEIQSLSIPYLLKGDVMTLTINGYELDLQKKV